MAAASGTIFFIELWILLYGNKARLPNGDESSCLQFEHRPPSALEFDRRAVVVRGRGHSQAVVAGRVAHRPVVKVVAKPRQEAGHIRRVADIAGAAVFDELGEAAASERDDRKPDASSLEHDVPESLFLQDRRGE